MVGFLPSHGCQVPRHCPVSYLLLSSISLYLSPSNLSPSPLSLSLSVSLIFTPNIFLSSLSPLPLIESTTSMRRTSPVLSPGLIIAGGGWSSLGSGGNQDNHQRANSNLKESTQSLSTPKPRLLSTPLSILKALPQSSISTALPHQLQRFLSLLSLLPLFRLPLPIQSTMKVQMAKLISQNLKLLQLPLPQIPPQSQAMDMSLSLVWSASCWGSSRSISGIVFATRQELGIPQSLTRSSHPGVSS
jgi:hypothetical protein